MNLFIKVFSVIFISCMLFYSCNKNPTTSNIPSGVALIDTLVNTSNRDVTINIPNKISINIPAGTGDGSVNLTVEEFEASSLPDDSEKQIQSVYDVKIGTITVFDKPIIITLPYDPTVLGDDVLSRNPGACFLYEETNLWKDFNGIEVDTTNSQIIIRTNHLTKLAWYRKLTSGGFTDELSSKHFNIYWVDGDVPSNSVYTSPNANWLVGTEPHYIQDIRVYLEESWSAFKKADLWVPDGKIEVRIQKLSSDGETSGGPIYISNNVKGEATQNLTPEELLPMVCAHELQHYVQDHYYMFTLSGHVIRWWLEVLAVQSDRLVWSGKPVYEAESYANKQIVDIIAKSWDDCEEKQNYYQAGGFLAYLSALRAGSRLDIPKLIKAGGKATDVSYFRTILDNQIKSSLSSTIGDEFSDYINWAYKGNGTITLPSTYVGTTPYALRSTFEGFNRNLNFASQVPYLAVRMPKIINKNNVGLKNVKLTLNQISGDISVNIYSRTNSTNVFIGTIANGESLITELPITDDKNSSTIAWLDVLVVNKSKDEVGSFNLDAELVDKFEFDHLALNVYCAATWEREIIGGPDPGKYTKNGYIGITNSITDPQNINIQGNQITCTASFADGDQATRSYEIVLTVNSIEKPTLITSFSCTETWNHSAYDVVSEERNSMTGVNIPTSAVCGSCFGISGDISSYLTDYTYQYTSTNSSYDPAMEINDKLISVDLTNGEIFIDFMTL